MVGLAGLISAQPFGDAPPAERLGLGRPSPCSAGIKNAGLAGLDASPMFGWCWEPAGLPAQRFLSQPNRGFSQFPMNA